MSGTTSPQERRCPVCDARAGDRYCNREYPCIAPHHYENWLPPKQAQPAPLSPDEEKVSSVA